MMNMEWPRKAVIRDSLSPGSAMKAELGISTSSKPSRKLALYPHGPIECGRFLEEATVPSTNVERVCGF
jgi:hypothetical protein